MRMAGCFKLAGLRLIALAACFFLACCFLLTLSAAPAFGQDDPGNQNGANQNGGANNGRCEPPELHYVPRPDDQLQDAVYAALREANERPPQVKAVIPEMAILYRELAFAEGLPRYKREEMQKKLESSLVRLGLFVIDDFRRQERKRPKGQKASLPHKLSVGSQDGDAGDGNSGGEAYGGAARANAEDLIDLITSTIAPETWDINGGIGTIRYYSLTPALVVRQTGTSQADVNRLMQGLR